MPNEFDRLSAALAERYRMDREIGRGGMARVYLAEDVKLHRQVAIKVLKPELAAVLGAERFVREIEIAARLTHPHILPLHESGEADGLLYYVMPFVEGESLRDRLTREKQLSLEESLDVTRTVADALSHAHSLGIVHRDIKPENILFWGGHAVVTDFGIAWAITEAGGDRLTETGIAVGTAEYMSPEQAAGVGEVDARSDIYALGCVLYELLAGQPPFTGPSVQAVLARHSLDPVPPLRTVRGTIPETLETAVLRALAKVPADRFATAREFAEALPRSAPAVDVSGPVLPARRWRPALVGVAGVLAMVAGAALWTLWTQRSDEASPQPSARLDIALPADAPMAAGRPMALSPDGRRLVYRAQLSAFTQLYLRDMGTGETQPIPGTRGGYNPFFSPDGEWLGFFGGGKLRKVSLAGGEPVVLADAPVGLGGAWAPDDTIYFNTQEGEGLSRVYATGEQAQKVTEAQDWWPDVLPGGEALLFIGHGAERGLVTGIHSLRNGQSRRLLAPAYYARYVPTGHLVYAERGKLLAVAFDLAALEVTSQPVTLLEDLRTAGPFGGAPFALSQDGLLVYAPGQDREFASLVWADHQGNIEPLGLEPGFFGESFSLSPDGRQVAVPIREGSGSDIWLYDIARGTLTRFTYGLRDNRRAQSQTPRWTPDGRHIVYVSIVFSSPEDEDPRSHLFWKPADGSREAVQLTPDDAPRQLAPDSFSPDGSVLTFFSRSAGTGFDLGFLRLDGVDPYAGNLPKPEVLLQTRYGEAWARFSPDGRWIAYMSDESGRYEVYVRPFPGPGPRHQISTDGGLEAVWHPSGHRLFYRAFGTQFYVVDVRLTPEFEASRPRLLFQGSFVNLPGHDVDISPGGDRFLTLHNPQRFEPNPTLTVITNFFDELRRRVPAGR